MSEAGFAVLGITQFELVRIHDLLGTLADLDEGENVSLEEIRQLCEAVRSGMDDITLVEHRLQVR